MSLDLYASRYLNDLYYPLIIDGNDPFGSEVGFLVKKDLPFKYELRSHKNREWINSLDNEKELLHSRDFTLLLFYGLNQNMNDRPLFAVGGIHNKSQYHPLKAQKPPFNLSMLKR